ncbi:MAG: ribonuclease III [Clostridiales bacterium]|nr:ribonuclease III [Clostridiales bacterium]
MDKSHAQRLTPTALAFLGDAAYALYVRKRLVESVDDVCGTLHAKATRFVNAAAQALAYDALEAAGVLTDEEKDVARRAKNAHLHTHSKAASIADYHRATALEAVIGWLEVTDNPARRDEILALSFAAIESDTH